MRRAHYVLQLAILPVVAAMVLAPPAVAEQGSIGHSHSGDARACVDVEIAGDRTPDYGCLTEALRRRIDATKPIANSPPFRLDGAAPNSIGLITPTEVKQQYGPNFGKSVVPYRPQRSYPTPLVESRP